MCARHARRPGSRCTGGQERGTGGTRGQSTGQTMTNLLVSRLEKLHHGRHIVRDVEARAERAGHYVQDKNLAKARGDLTSTSEGIRTYIGTYQT